MNQWLRSVFFGFSIAAAGAVAGVAKATPTLVVDADSGQVLEQQQATVRWFPASLTKLVTVYVALHAVQTNRISLDTPLTVSARAARMAPSKMGFKPGTEVTLDNALKMLMVKSANDLAVTIAEGVSGSVEAFADEMNAQAQRLGMRESYFVNPNGLPDDQQVTSARDMAIVARALYQEFPERRGLYGIGALRLGDMIIRTHNGLMGRYPGADGMKTGFTCAAGFNVVASATRAGRHIITVVLGSPSARERTAKAVELLERGFAGGSSLGTLDGLPSQASMAAPNMRWDVCVRHGKTKIAEDSEETPSPPPLAYQANSERPERDIFLNPVYPARLDGHAVAALPRPNFEPVPVYIGRAPGWNGPPPQVSENPNSGAPEKPKQAKEKSKKMPPRLAQKTQNAKHPGKHNAAARTARTRATAKAATPSKPEPEQKAAGKATANTLRQAAAPPVKTKPPKKTPVAGTKNQGKAAASE
jgi:D-alanyl-D-alanine carboxypeptidase